MTNLYNDNFNTIYQRPQQQYCSALRTAKHTLKNLTYQNDRRLYLTVVPVTAGSVILISVSCNKSKKATGGISTFS